MKILSNLINTLKTPILGALLLTLGSISHAQAGLIFEFSSDDIVVGDTFSIDVIFDNQNAQILEGFAFDINDELLQTVNYLGDTLDSVDFSPTLFGLDIDNFVISANSMNAAEIILARLSFTAHTAGSDTLSLLGDDGFFSGLFLAGFEYEAIDSSVSFNVRDVPAPATLAFIFLAVMYMGQRARKNSTSNNKK